MKRRTNLLLLCALIIYIFRRIRRQFLLKEGLRRLPSQRVLITGGAGGLGLEIAKEFIRRGCRKIVLWDLNMADLTYVAALLREEADVQVDVRECNLCEMANINVAAEEALATGRVDVLVNNAGIISGDSFLSIPNNQMELTMRVNAMAHIWTVKAFLPKMLEHSGSIISIASVAGRFPNPKLTDYCASKYAAVGFSESLRVELKSSGVSNVKVLVVCPGQIKTELFAGADFRYASALSPLYVAQCVVDAHLTRDSGIMTLPRIFSLGALASIVLPRDIFDFFCRPAWGAMNTHNKKRASCVFSRMSSSDAKSNERIDF